jgi:hypothetical protein
MCDVCDGRGVMCSMLEVQTNSHLRSCLGCKPGAWKTQEWSGRGWLADKGGGNDDMVQVGI